MARRRVSRSSRARGSGGGAGFGTLVVAMMALAFGVAGGYVWRSMAPLPLAKPWGGDDAFAEVTPLSTTTTASRPIAPTPTPRPSAAESAEIARLRAEIDRLKQAQSQTAQDVAEMQIKSVLGEE